MKYNKSKIMKKAWNIFRSTKKSFSEALKKAWTWAKETACTEERYQIADWFMNKNYEKVSSAHCMCYSSFSKNDIVKQTEKALLVCLGMMTKSGAETNYTKNVWVPKSVVKTYLA